MVEANKLLSKVDRLVEHGRVEKARKLFPRRVEARARSNELREELVVKQLETAPYIKEGWTGKIVVVEGAFHTGVYHRIKKKAKKESYPSTEIKYAFDEMPFVFDPENTLSRRRRFFPERKITREEYDRAFISTFVLRPGAIELWPKTSVLKRVEFAHELSQRLTTEEVHEVLDAFSKLKKEAAFKIKSLPLPNTLTKREKANRRKAARYRMAYRIAGHMVKTLVEKYEVTIKTETKEDLEKSQ